jgi:peptidoglycan-associated lipoprotein
MIKKRLFLALLTASTAWVLTACGSSVKLDEVPVEDRSGATVTGAGSAGQGTGPAGGAGVTQSAVKPVELNPGGAAGGPAQGAARVVYFDYDSYAIKPEFQPAIEAHSRYLRADKTRKVQVEGHTDERGGREYNVALGQRRAEAVRKALELLGVADAQVEAVSFGKEKPAAEGADEAAMAKNRRAEIVYR